MAIQDLYRAQLLRGRAQFLSSLTEFKGSIQAELTRLSNECGAIIDHYAKEGFIQRAALKRIGSEITGVVAQRTEGIKSLLDNQIRVSINQAAVAKQKAGNVFGYYVKAAAREKGIVKVPEINVAFGGGMSRFTEELVNQVWNKRYADGRRLSRRIWNFEKYTQRFVLSDIKTGIEEGKPAREIAKKLKGYLTGKGKGNPTYKTMRIARTETNEAYKLAHEEISKQQTFVKGIKWNLSGSHKKTDVCDDLAAGGPKGNGVYPVDEYPGTPHPLCLCFPTDETPTVDEFLKRGKDVPKFEQEHVGQIGWDELQKRTDALPGRKADKHLVDLFAQKLRKDYGIAVENLNPADWNKWFLSGMTRNMRILPESLLKSNYIRRIKFVNDFRAYGAPAGFKPAGLYRNQTIYLLRPNKGFAVNTSAFHEAAHAGEAMVKQVAMTDPEMKGLYQAFLKTGGPYYKDYAKVNKMEDWACTWEALSTGPTGLSKDLKMAEWVLKGKGRIMQQIINLLRAM